MNSREIAMREALFWNKEENGYVRCGLCPHRCRIRENAAGICGVRGNHNGKLIISGYGQVSSVALDPIEKKPLYMFHPGKRILSIGGYGCNLRCQFCQNHEISMVYADNVESGAGRASQAGNGRSAGRREQMLGRRFTPEDIAATAIQTIPEGNIGVAYTYNEPLIGYEFLLDCSTLVRDAGLSNVVVTNGYISKEPLMALLPLTDAMNIDLKGFSSAFYRNAGGDLDTVRETITLAFGRSHVEITTLVIPGENEDDIEELAKWLSSISPDIPLHLSRFFPRYKYSDRTPTPREMIVKSCEVAKKYLSNVFAGNMA